MTEWKECKISDIGTVVGGATPSTKNKKNYENGDIPWITPKDLSTFYGRYIKCGERNLLKRDLIVVQQDYYLKILCYFHQEHQ